MYGIRVVDDSLDFSFGENYLSEDFILNRKIGDKVKSQEFKPPAWEFTCVDLDTVLLY